MLHMVASPDLRKGMFVAKLDRPWLESPFLMQGFLIEDDEQLAQLRELCRHVVVDRSRSVGLEYRAEPVNEPSLPHHHPPVRVRPEKPLYRSKRKLKLSPLVETGERDLGGHKFATVQYVDEVPIEDALPAAKIAYQGTLDLLHDINTQVAAGMAPDMEHVGLTVDGLVECVVRNADALVWLSRLKRSDNETYDHTLSSSIHLMAFGRYLGLPPDELHAMGTGSLLKDIGFIRLPAELLRKSSGLTPPERDRMRKHVWLAREILGGDFDAFEPAMRDIILKHHERLDGSGYPDRLCGKDIGLAGEMAGLTDSYCAMLYPRSFRPARKSQWIIDQINAMRDRAFTASVVDEFVQFIGIYPVGTLVELNSGEVGVVFEQNRVRRLKPRIMVLLGPDKSPNPSPGIVNLLNDPLVREGVPYQIVRVLPSGSFGLDPKEFYL